MRGSGFLLCVVLVGCAEDDLLAEGFALSDDAVGVALMPFDVSARLGSSALRVQPLRNDRGSAVVPVREAEDGSLVVDAHPALDLILQVDRLDAASFVQEAGALGGARLGREQVWIDPGVRVEVLEERTDAVLVELLTDHMVLEAWVDTVDVDQLVVQQDPDAMGGLGGEHLLEVPVDLLDAPDGVWLGRLVADTAPQFGWRFDGRDVVPVEVLGAPVDGFTPVRFEEDGVAVEAWTEAPVIAPEGLGVGMWGRGWGCGGCRSFWSRSPDTRLAVGTRLFDAPHGERVGEVLRGGASDEDEPERGFATHAVDRRDGFVGVEVDTPIGVHVVWVLQDEAERIGAPKVVLAPLD